MEEKTVYHIDVNSAYLAGSGLPPEVPGSPHRPAPDSFCHWRGYQPEAWDYPAKSIPAKRYKIHTGEPVPQARAEMSRSSDRAAQLWPV